MGKMRFWTAEETDMARHLVAIFATDRDCIEAINRTIQACRARIRYVDDPEVRARMSSKGRTRSPKKSRSKGLNHMAEGIKGVPDDVLADARRRACAARTLTSWVFGDPPPGSSALDRKNSGAAA